MPLVRLNRVIDGAHATVLAKIEGRNPWFPRQKPTEVSMLKCYDSVTDGSVSRWSFHAACVDPTAPDDAPCRKNVVVRAFVFF